MENYPDTRLEAVLPLAANALAPYACLLVANFELAKHHQRIIQKLEAVERGQIRRLIIAMPPRHGKSLITSQIFPSWYLGRHPQRSVICATYGQDLSDDFGRRVRNLLSDPLHRAIFPDSLLSADSNSQRRFDLTAGGSYFAIGRGGPITGRGANLLIIDDPLKDREEAYSATIRAGLHEWFGTVAFTRLQPDAGVVVVATRWHEDDLSGRLLREYASEGWELVSLPAIADTRDEFRQEGEALWPERYPLEALESIRRQIGSASFAALYQQRPAAAEGAVFKREWWRTYRQVPDKFRMIVQSWDTAFKTGEENDYSACTTWGASTGYYLLSLWRGRVEFPELQRKLIEQAAQWRPQAILVEDKASGQSLLQQLRRATSFAVIAIKVDHDKQTRANAVTPMFEAGKVFLPESCPLLHEYQDELATFPAGAHDDMVDSTTQALNYLHMRCPIEHAEIPQPAFVSTRPEDRIFMRHHQSWAKTWDKQFGPRNENTWFRGCRGVNRILQSRGGPNAKLARIGTRCQSKVGK